MANVVLGGGISGLSTAYYLSKCVSNGVKVYESSPRLGGWIKTTKIESGTIFEQGPRTVRCGGLAAGNTLQLVNELGLSSMIKPVPFTDEAAKNQMIYFNHQLIKLPKSWTALFKINPPFIKPFLFAIVKDLKTSRKIVTDESIYDFVTRRFGNQYAEILLSAMICGIFGGDAKEISVKALMNNLFEKEQKYGSVFGGMIYSLKDKLLNRTVPGSDKVEKKERDSKGWYVWSLKSGLETLPNELGNHLGKHENVEINLNAKCTKVSFENGKVLLTVNGKTEVAQHLYSSLPSKDLAQILEDEHSFLKNELSSIPFVSMAVVNLEYNGDLLSDKGFGFLVPPNQNLPILGIIFDSCIFPQLGKTVLTVMMGGKWFEHHFGSNSDKEKFLEIARDQIKRILKIDQNPTNQMVTVMNECIPQYIVGHSDRVKRIRNYIAELKLPLTLNGNSFDGVGVNDAILSAKKSVEIASKNFFEG